MKRLYYYVEKTKYAHLLMLLLYAFVLFYFCIYRKDNTDNIEVLVISTLMVLYNLYKFTSGFMLWYNKHICTSKGQKYIGRIVGKIGVNTKRNGYFYKLVILYEKGKTITPLIQSKYVDALNSKQCTVNLYDNKVYVNDYSLCQNGDTPVNIKITENETY